MGLFLPALILQAAPPRIRAIKTSSANQTGSAHMPKLPRYVGARGAVMGVNYHSLVRRATQASDAVQQQPWLSQQAKRFQAWQLKRSIRKQNASLEKAIQHAESLELARETLPPLLPERAFVAKTLMEHTPTNVSLKNMPTLPFMEETTGTSYRGLALSTDGNAIRNILINGMRTQDVGQNSNVFLHSLAAGTRGFALQLYRHPSISVTHQPSKAVEWGNLRLHPIDRPILTIVKMNGQFLGKNIEFIMEDIPANQIEELVVLLNVDNKLTWCKIQLNQDHTFTLTPYKPLYP